MVRTVGAAEPVRGSSAGDTAGCTWEPPPPLVISVPSTVGGVVVVPTPPATVVDVVEMVVVVCGTVVVVCDGVDVDVVDVGVDVDVVVGLQSTPPLAVASSRCCAPYVMFGGTKCSM